MWTCGAMTGVFPSSDNCTLLTTASSALKERTRFIMACICCSVSAAACRSVGERPKRRTKDKLKPISFLCIYVKVNDNTGCAYTTYKYKTAVSIIKDGVVDNQQIGKIAPTVAKESVVFCSPALLSFT